MNRRIVLILLSFLTSGVLADTMVLRNGAAVSGSFQGFSAHQFQFKSQNGSLRSEYGADVQSVVLDAPLRTVIVTSEKQYDDVVFSRVDHNLIRFRKEGQSLSEPVMVLKGVTVIGPAASDPVPAPMAAPSPAAAEAPGIPRLVSSSRPTAARDWKRSGKWREIDDDKSIVISQGEAVDPDEKVKKGYVNVVHFHYPQAMSSVRQGSYVQGLAVRSHGRIVLLKVIAEDFDAPVCKSLNLKSLPQFWFYSSEGRLVRKLTERFTESDIDAALREAARN